jgi:hypothetical protein
VPSLENCIGKNPTDIEWEFFTWAQGYASGINLGRPKSYSDLNAKTTDEMKRYLRQYCATHPLADYAEAVRKFLETLPLIEDGLSPY